MSRKEDCQDCPHLHSAGRKDPEKHLKKYNRWCCYFGIPAAQAIGRCRLRQGPIVVNKSKEK